jgi:hypothetical protein
MLSTLEHENLSTWVITNAAAVLGSRRRGRDKPRAWRVWQVGSSQANQWSLSERFPVLRLLIAVVRAIIYGNKL